MKKLLSLCTIILLLFTLVSCGGNDTSSSDTTESTESNTTSATQAEDTTSENTTIIEDTTTGAKSIILATTTSTEDSGLLDYLLPEFQKDTGIEVKVVSKGTGEAIKLAEAGDADCLLVHAKSQEEKFIEEGHGTKRIQLMYNDFVLVGPEDDPLGIKANAPNDIKEAFKMLSEGSSQFISRGDGSGTETKEKSIWTSLEIEPEGDFYVSAGKGMGAVLTMADEMNGYTLSDRATYLSMRDDLGLQVVCEKDTSLMNQYSILRLNYEKLGLDATKDAAEEWIAWMFSDKALEMINEFGKDEYGESLFITNPDPDPLS